MKWLQWAPFDLENGMGGVETHARSVARELQKLGVQTYFSSDPKDIVSPQWDVVHTHGSGVPIRKEISQRATNIATRPIRIHTLHGMTYERMWACGEMTWPGGYAATTRELSGVLMADVVASIHPKMSFYKLGEKLKKNCVLCWNGWDSDEGEDPTLPEELALKDTSDSWVFVGRGNDTMKGVDRLFGLIASGEVKVTAVPGAGFEDQEEVLKTGRLNHAQIGALLKKSKGLILPSRYEGLALVVLEALGNGIPVICSNVGGMGLIPPNIHGYYCLDDQTPDSFSCAIKEASKLDTSETARLSRAHHNQSLLYRWSDVAQVCFNAVQTAIENRHKGETPAADHSV